MAPSSQNTNSWLVPIPGQNAAMGVLPMLPAAAVAPLRFQYQTAIVTLNAQKPAIANTPNRLRFPRLMEAPQDGQVTAASLTL